jgi:hypothetical protein
LIAVSQTDGDDTLCKHIGEETRATLLLRLAATDSRVQDALGLIQTADPGWGAVYDVLKFVEDTQVAQKTKIRKYIRTASWYRHLGEAKREPLPADPPTLNEAREYAFGLLREWIDRRLQQP